MRFTKMHGLGNANMICECEVRRNDTEYKL